MRRLSYEQVLRLHDALIEEFGGTAGIRGQGLMDSALNTPFATFGDRYLYTSLQAKAAQLGFRLVSNHPFIDGNKRIGAHVMLVFLALNGIELDYKQEDLGVVNALIHRNYMEIGSEVHIDMFDDRIEIYSPGGMVSGISFRRKRFVKSSIKEKKSNIS